MKRLTDKRRVHQYNPQTVLYLVGNVNYCYLHLQNGEIVMSCRTLKWFEGKWPHLLRIHKRTLINPVHILSCKLANSSTATNCIRMTNEAEFEIARRRVSAVVQTLVQLNLVSPKEGNAKETEKKTVGTVNPSD